MGPRFAFVAVPLLLVLTAVFLPARDTAAPYLVRDVNPATASSDLFDLTPVGDAVLFRRYASPSSQLWRSDGTGAQTSVVYEGSRWPAREITVVGDTAFFTTGDALWKLDDPMDEPVRLETVAAQALTAANGLLFFATHHDDGCQLWRSDGSEEGTFPVVLLPVPCWERYATLTDEDAHHRFPLVSMNQSLFFLVNAGSRLELWRSDGTTEGTSQLTFIAGARSRGLDLVAANGTLFFTVRESYDHELWKSDGTPEGTERVTFFSGDPHWTDGFPSARAGNLLFFATCAGHAYRSPECDLWRTDGTAAGTVAVADFVPPINSDDEWNLPRLVGLGDLVLFFNDNDGCHELWRSDGTAAGTMRLGAFCAPRWGGRVAVGGRLFFGASTPDTGMELWTSDGTEAGTRMVADIDPGPGSGLAWGLSGDEASGSVYFAGGDPTIGSELWRSDGTVGGTELIADINPGPGSSWPAPAVRAGEQLFLVATGPRGSRELWRTDGTASGTREVADLTTSAASSDPAQLTAIDGRVFFVAKDVDETPHYWASDGSEDGTVKLTEVSPSSPSHITRAGLLAFFTCSDPTGRRALWRSDGTPAGSFELTDIDPGRDSSYVDSSTDVGGTLFFTTENADGAPELWKSDGTVAGTALVAGFDGALTLRTLAAVGGTLFLVARDRSNIHLWASDGTPEGTRLVQALPLEHYEPLAEVDGALLFTSPSYDRHRTKVWRSDGMATGTALLATLRGANSRTLVRTALGDALLYSVGSSLWRFDFATGVREHVGVIAPSFIRPALLDGFTNVNGTVFLYAREVGGVAYLPYSPGAGRVELWATSGTAATTVRVAVLPDGAAPSSFTNVYGTLLFVLDGAIWKSDGTPEGTGPVTNPELSVSQLTPAGGTLFFAASEPSHGRELWRLPLCAGGPPCTTERCDGVDCTDDDPCTLDSCSLDTGCSHTKLPGCPQNVTPVSTTTTTFAGSTTSSLDTTTSSTSTTTSTMPCPRGPEGLCDDGDPCTEDRCTPGGCRHAPRLGLDAVRCRFTGESHQPPACDGERIPASVTARLDEAERLIKRAARLEDRRAAKQQAQRALRLLRNAARDAQRLDDEPGVSSRCAAALARRIQDTRTQALRWFLGTLAR